MNSYRIETQYLDKKMIKQVIESRGNWTETDNKEMTLLYIDGKFLKATDHYQYKAFIKSVVDNGKQGVTNKEDLYRNFSKKYPHECKQYMLPQRIIKMNDYRNVPKHMFSEKTPQIIKAVFAGHGASLDILTSFNQYLEYIDNNKKQYGRHGWMLEPYIDTLIFNNKKFHIRAYFMYFEGISYLFRWSRILLAKQNYVHGDWANQDVHISHFNDQPHIQFPEQFVDKFGQDNANKVNKQMIDISNCLSGIITAGCYKPDSEHCFEVFGVDFVITQDFDVKLLEANEYTSFAHNADMTEFFTKYFEGIMQEVVDKLVPPKIKPEPNNYFIKLTPPSMNGGLYYNKYNEYKKRYTQLKGGSSVIEGSGWLENRDDAVIKFSDLKKLQEDKQLDSINKLFKQHQVQFPYKYRYKTVEQVLTGFENLHNYTQRFSQEPYRVNEFSSMKLRLPITFTTSPKEKPVFVSMRETNDTYTNMDWITDYFIEDSRMKCQRARKQYSPHNAWLQYGDYLTNAIKLIINRRQDLTVENLREALYKDRMITEECGHEKPSFTKMLFEKLGITKDSLIFDATAGWGDRMIASLSIGCKYLGVDPNENSQPGFTKMSKMLGQDLGNENRCEILPLAMPDCVLPGWTNNFDLVFLSPPSFDSEVYSDDKGQSVIMHPDKENWFNNFMFKTVDRCWSLMKVGGYFVIQSIIINDIAPYIFATYPDAFYCGAVAVQFPSRYKPMWIWKKMDPSYKPDDRAHRLHDEAKRVLAEQRRNKFV